VNTRSYRADVTSIVQSKGDGSYTVADLIKVQNDVTVADINGVSLIVLFDDGNAANDRDVYIYDGNDSTGPGIGSWAQMLPGIQYASGIAQLQLHVGDGQNFSVDNGDDGAVLLNGATVAGNATTQSGDIFQGDSVPDAGSGGTTNGGLWDIKTFDIPAGVLATGSNTLQLTSNQVVDYLGLVVAVVSVPHVQ
jgi:hypothetical protein